MTLNVSEYHHSDHEKNSDMTVAALKVLARVGINFWEENSLILIHEWDANVESLQAEGALHSPAKTERTFLIIFSNIYWSQ